MTGEPEAEDGSRMDLDPQVVGMIRALDAGFPRVEMMTGAQGRVVIRVRFVTGVSATTSAPGL
jgi:hypothetical protein